MPARPQPLLQLAYFSWPSAAAGVMKSVFSAQWLAIKAIPASYPAAWRIPYIVANQSAGWRGWQLMQLMAGVMAGGRP